MWMSEPTRMMLPDFPSEIGGDGATGATGGDGGAGAAGTGAGAALRRRAGLCSSSLAALSGETGLNSSTSWAAAVETRARARIRSQVERRVASHTRRVGPGTLRITLPARAIRSQG